MPLFSCISLSSRKPCDIPTRTVTALGNFDGVHLGHRGLLDATVAKAKILDAAPSVFCFDPPSSDFLFTDRSPEHLCTTEEKLQKFADCGITHVFLADFLQLKTMDAQDFCKDILKDGCHAVATVCGFNFRFGHMGKGTPADLQAAFADSVTVPPRTLNGKTVSSTLIRSELQSGKPELAASYLGEPFSLTAPVISGKALGRTVGFPTANQAFPAGMLIPKHGVYAVECEVDGVPVRGVANVGCHPTVDEKAPVNCETFLLDFSGNLYGKTIKTAFLRFLREERKFDSLEELKCRIALDVETVKRL